MANKIFLRNPGNFNAETVEYYKTFAEFVPEEEADIIVINDFNPIKTKKIVACNSTGTDHIQAKRIIKLQGEDLSDYTAVAELCLGMMIIVTRLFKIQIMIPSRILFKQLLMEIKMILYQIFFNSMWTRKYLKVLLVSSMSM